MFYKQIKIKGLLWPSLTLVAVGVCLFGLMTLTSNQTIGHASGSVGNPSNVRLDGNRTTGNLPVIWDAASGTDVKYHITYSSDGAQSWSMAAFDHATNSITISGVTDSASYIVGVRAYNSSHSSSWVNSGSIGPFVQQIQSNQNVSSVSSLTASSTANSLIATWTAATGSDVKYHITYSSDGGWSWSLGAINHTSTTITITGTDPLKTYIVGVRAFNDNSSSGWVNSSSIDPFLTNPGRPGLQRTGRGNGTIPIYWKKSSTASVTYNVRYATEAAPTTWTTTSNVTTSTCRDGYIGSDASDYVCYEINGVTNTTSYYVAVSAAKSGASSGWQQSYLISPIAAPRVDVRQSGCSGSDSSYIMVVDWANHHSGAVAEVGYRIGSTGGYTDLDVSSTAPDYRQLNISSNGAWFHDPDILEKKATAYDFSLKVRLTHSILGSSDWHIVNMKAGTDANTAFWWSRCPADLDDDFLTITRRNPSTATATWSPATNRYDYDVEIRSKLSTDTNYGSWTRIGTSCWSGSQSCANIVSHTVTNLSTKDVQFRLRAREPLTGVAGDWTTYTSLAP